METLFVLLTLLSLGSVVYYARLAASLPPFPLPNAPRSYGLSDAIFAALLILWFLNNVVESFGRTQTVTLRLIIGSSILYALLIFIILCFLLIRRKNPVQLFGLRWPGWKQGLLLALGALLAAYPVIVFAQVIVQVVLGPKAAAQDILLFLQNASLPSDRLIVIIMAVLVAPLAEEIIFRGYIYGVLRSFAGRWIGILGSSLIFAAVHVHLPSLAGLFLLAVALSLAYERTGSLWAPIFMHSTFNAVTVAATLVWPSLVK